MSPLYFKTVYVSLHFPDHDQSHVGTSLGPGVFPEGSTNIHAAAGTAEASKILAEDAEALKTRRCTHHNSDRRRIVLRN